MKEHLLIAGDLIPTELNYKEFIEGKSDIIFGKQLSELFSNAKIACCNLEGALTDTDNEINKEGANIKAPKKSITGIKKLGINLVMLANNHVMDYGEKGFKDTVKTLSANGISYIGAGENENDISTYTLVELEGKKVVLYNVAETEFNIARQNYPGVNRFEEYRVCCEIANLKKKNDFVVVIYHGGVEKFRYPSPNLQKRLRLIVDCGADVVLAQHSHCIGTYECYRESIILYGQGNFCFSRGLDEYTASGLLVDIIVREEKLVCEFIKIIRKGGYVEYDKTQDLTEFYARSKNMNDEIIEQQYNEFCNARMSKYLHYFERSGIADKILKKCFKNHDNLRKKEELLGAINMMRCEVHQEVFLTGLLNLFDKYYGSDR